MHGGSRAPSAPIRVARIITRLNIGGPAIQAVTLSERLAAHGFETLLVYGALDAGEGDMSYLLDGREVSTAYTPAMRRAVSPAADVRAFSAMLQRIRAFQPHIVHTHTAKAGTIGRTAAFAYNRGASLRAHTVHTYHGHSLEGYFRYASSAFLAVERLLARTTDRLIAISPRVAADLRDRYHIGRAEQWAIVPLGFDLEALAATVDDAARADARRRLCIPAATPVVSIVGRLTAIKQHELFLHVAREVHAVNASTMFLIVGDGDRRAELERLVRELGLTDNVRFLGWRRDLETIYGATDVCVLTSRNEGTPVAVIEALAAGVPVVSTDVGGVRDVMADPLLGAIAPDQDTNALAAHVIRLLSPDERTPAKMTGRSRSVTARYGFDRLVHDIVALYRSLVDA